MYFKRITSKKKKWKMRVYGTECINQLLKIRMPNLFK